MGSEATQRQGHSHPLALSALPSMLRSAGKPGEASGLCTWVSSFGRGCLWAGSGGATGSGVPLPQDTSQLHAPREVCPRGVALTAGPSSHLSDPVQMECGARLGPQEVACTRSQHSKPGASEELAAWQSSKQRPPSIPPTAHLGETPEDRPSRDSQTSGPVLKQLE